MITAGFDLTPDHFQSGKKVNEVVSLVDLAATFMELAAVPDFNEWIKKIDG